MGRQGKLLVVSARPGAVARSLAQREAALHSLRTTRFAVGASKGAHGAGAVV